MGRFYHLRGIEAPRKRSTGAAAPPFHNGRLLLNIFASLFPEKMFQDKSECGGKKALIPAAASEIWEIFPFKSPH